MSETLPTQPAKAPEHLALEVRASAAVNSLLQEIATLHGRMADLVGEVAVLRAANAALQQVKAPE